MHFYDEFEKEEYYEEEKFRHKKKLKKFKNSFVNDEHRDSKADRSKQLKEERKFKGKD